MLKRISPHVLLAALCCIACDDSASSGPEASQDASIQTDASRQEDGTSNDAASMPSDLGLNPGDIVSADMGAPNECLEDNGGCGDAMFWRCADHPDEPPTCTLIADADFSALTAGVSRIVWGGALPDSLVVHGRNAFPLAVDENGRTMIAAARVAAGRVVHVGHEGLMNVSPDGEADGFQFVRNVMTWLAAERGAQVVLEPGLEHLSGLLTDMGYEVRALEGDSIPADTAVLVISSYGPFTAEFAEAVQTFVSDGGGLFTGGHAWWFAQSTGQDPATQYPGNRFLDPMGLVIAGLGDIIGSAVGPGDDPPARVYHAALALDALREHLDGTTQLDADALSTASATVGHAVRVLPPDHPYFQRVQRLIESQPIEGPRAGAPLRPADDPLNALLVKLQVRLAETAPADALPPIAAANDFPGNASDADPVIRTVTVDGNYAGRNARFAFSGPREAVWRSTGLYAQPGEPITIDFEMPPGPGVSILIGCHTDALWDREEWERYPVITRNWPVTDARTVVGNAFGGPIYVRFSPGSRFGPLTLTVTGAIEMPLFRRGETDARAWRDTIRTHPAPWAELAGERIVITLPSESVRSLDNPDEILAFWDSVLDLSADLAAIDRERARPERFVVDRQLSIGWMHSGYPLMAHLPSTSEFLDIDQVREMGAWGPFHEIGHNHQWLDWVLPGTTEANVNLWSVYISEVALNLDRSRAHPALAPEARASRMQDYLSEGANFANWTVWTALETYLQLQVAFGWQFYQDLFSEYLDIPDARALREDSDRIDEWVIRSSQRAGVNLIPFYESWGVPISERVRIAVGDLAEWLENPMLP